VIGKKFHAKACAFLMSNGFLMTQMKQLLDKKMKISFLESFNES
jgi:hypothetical protein